MNKVINIAQIRNNKAKAQKIKFNLDKDYLEIPLMQNNKEYNRAKAKRLAEKLKKENER